MAATGSPALAQTVFEAVITIAFTGGPGFVAGALGLIDQDFLRSVSRFQLTCLSPCLIFSTFGSRLTLERVGQVWPLVFWSCAQLVAGVAVSRALLRANTPSAPWARPGAQVFPQLLQLAVCFQNIGAFTLPMLQTLCQADGLFHGHPEGCFEEGTLMVFGYHVPWDLSMWTQGYASLLGVAHAQAAEEAAVAGHRDPDLHVEARAPPSHRKAHPPRPGRGPLERLAGYARAGRAAVLHCVNPIFVAMLLGLAVGIVPSLRALLFAHGAPLAPVGVALKRAGGIVPVLALQILTGTLGLASRDFWRSGSSWGAVKGGCPSVAAGGALEAGLVLRRHASQTSWVVTVLMGKLVVLPLLGFFAFSCLARLQVAAALASHSPGGLLASAAIPLAAAGRALWPDDRLLRTVVVLQWSAPSCLSIITLCHHVRLSESVTKPVAALYLLMYALSVVTTTGWVSTGLSMF